MNNDDSVNELPQPSASPSLAIKSSKHGLIDGWLTLIHPLILFCIGATYYKDTLSVNLLIRSLSQINIASSGIRIVVTATIISLAIHTFQTIPEPPHNSQWLHGGLLVDFVGEKRPTRSGLLFSDALIFGFQLLYLTLLHEKSRSAGIAEGQQAPAQTIEAEEAGVREGHLNEGERGEHTESIELQTLLEPEERDSENRAKKATIDETVIYIRKSDILDVIRNPGGAAESPESADAFRSFIARVNAVRARRAQLAAANTNPTATTAPLAPPM